jgi:hypothetical protein
MRRRIGGAILVVAGTLGTLGYAASPAGADATVCYKVAVTVNGEPVVDQTNMPGCTTVDTP